MSNLEKIGSFWQLDNLSTHFRGSYKEGKETCFAFPSSEWNVFNQPWEPTASGHWVTDGKQGTVLGCCLSRQHCPAPLGLIPRLAEVRAGQNESLYKVILWCVMYPMLPMIFLISNRFLHDICCFSFLNKTLYSRKTAGRDRAKCLNILFTDNPNVQNNSPYPNSDMAVK